MGFFSIVGSNKVCYNIDLIIKTTNKEVQDNYEFRRVNGYRS